MTMCMSKLKFESQDDDDVHVQLTTTSHKQDDDRMTMCLSKYHRTSRVNDACMRAVLKSVRASRVKERACEPC